MKRRLIGGALSLVVIVGVFAFLLPRIADYGSVWGSLRQLGWRQVAALTVAELLNLSTFAPPYMAALPGLDYGRGTVISQASTASTYIAPGGAAVGMGVAFAMLKGWGFAPAAIGLAVSLTGIWNQLFALGAPALAAVLITLQGETSAALQTAAVIGLALFVAAAGALAAAFATNRFARWVGDTAARVVSRVLALFRRGPVAWGGESVVRFRLRAVGLLRRRWPFLTLATIAGQVTVFVVLVTCLRVVGVGGDQVSFSEAFAAWSFVRLIGSVPITPGGIGIVELGLTGMLVGFGGGRDGVVAAVLLYRVITVLPTLVLGLVSTALWKRLRPADVIQNA